MLSCAYQVGRPDRPAGLASEDDRRALTNVAVRASIFARGHRRAAEGAAVRPDPEGVLDDERRVPRAQHDVAARGVAASGAGVDAVRIGAGADAGTHTGAPSKKEKKQNEKQEEGGAGAGGRRRRMRRRGRGKKKGNREGKEENQKGRNEKLKAML